MIICSLVNTYSEVLIKVNIVLMSFSLYEVCQKVEEVSDQNEQFAPNNFSYKLHPIHHQSRCIIRKSDNNIS